MLIFSIIFAILIIVRAIIPAPMTLKSKIILSAIACLISLKFFISHLITGRMFYEPAIPKFFIIFGTWLFGIVFIFFFLIIFKDLCFLLVLLINSMTKKYQSIQLKSFFNIFTLVLLGLSIIAATFGLISGLAVPSVKEQNITIQKLPSSLNNFTIAVLTDLHIDRLTDKSKIEKIVKKTNNLQPNIIVILGDVADGSTTELAELLAPLQNLKAKNGVYGVVGNHEYYSGYEDYQKLFKQFGVKMLNNKFIPLMNNQIALIGITDRAALQSRFKSKLPAPNLSKAAKGSELYPIKILLAHRPAIASDAKKFNIDLQLSGHTHGGSILLFDSIVAMSNGSFSSGLYKLPNSKTQLYVSNGSGIWSGFPFRIGRASEITLIRLKR